MNTESLIENSDLVENVYGYWPDFHDAEIVSFKFIRARSSIVDAIIEINYSESKAINVGTSSLDYIRDKNMIITIMFNDITKSKIEDFNQQNVIERLIINKVAAGLNVQFIPSYGADIEIICNKITVTGIAPYA